MPENYHGLGRLIHHSHPKRGKIMNDIHITLEGLRNVVLKLADHLGIKIFVAYIFLALSWTFDGKVEVIFALLTLFIIDAITGTLVALKQKSFSSRGVFRTPVKFFVYFLMLIVSRMADKALPVPVLSPVMDSFLVITESVSILENIYKLGFPVPLFLVTKLKAYYDKK